jgi:multisubunit Na+/H+ antiporter MnhG subunit
MQFARKALLVLATAILPALLFAAAVDIGVLHIVGSPAPIKKILSKSGIYGSAVDQVLHENQKVSANGNEVSLTDPAIKAAAQKSFSPKVVQDTTEKIIDGTYDWLSGKSSQPTFNVDLSAAKATFASNVGAAATERASTLPVCPGRTLPSTTDPLNITCVPRGITPAQIGAEAQNDVLHSEGFLDNPVITPDQFKNSGSSQTIFNDQLKNLPDQYKRIKATPVILIILSILAILGVIFLSATKRKGLRHAGIVLATVGIFMVVFAWGLNRVVAHNLVPNINLDNKVLQNNVRKLAADTAHGIERNYWQFGTVYTALGVLAIGGAQFINRSNKEAAVDAKDSQPSPADVKQKRNSKTSSSKN